MITALAKSAAQAARELAVVDETFKNKVLLDMAAKLRESAQEILSVNTQEVARATENGLDSALIDRLILNEERIEAMASGIETIAELSDPVGQERHIETRPNGIKISKMRVPLGVICMIYESRPNVTADAGALCFKSGNAVILRGGKEALDTSKVIASILQTVLKEHGLPPALITVVPDPDRALMLELLQQENYIDVVIPRGGEGLIRYVTDNSTIPVIQHFKGVCHLYVDKDANTDKGLDLLINGKTQRTGVCNALECLLVHKDIASSFMPRVVSALAEKNVEIEACKESASYFSNPTVLSDSEFGQEYLGLKIAVRIVDDFHAAIEHIAEFGSNHTEVICTENAESARLFQRSVDASVVMVNASSRFSDGSELGLGAEIGIATTKLHAYGPMGLESLTTEKFLVLGEGQVRA